MTTTGRAFRHYRRAAECGVYSAEYRRDLRLAAVEIAMLLRQAELPLERIVWRARSAYQACWAAELERTRPC